MLLCIDGGLVSEALDAPILQIEMFVAAERFTKAIPRKVDMAYRVEADMTYLVASVPATP